MFRQASFCMTCNECVFTMNDLCDLYSTKEMLSMTSVTYANFFVDLNPCLSTVWLPVDLVVLVNEVNSFMLVGV